MASNAFNLVAQLQIQGPIGLSPVLARARRMLKGGLKADVNLKFNANTNRQLTALHKNLTLIDVKLKSITGSASTAAASMSALTGSINKISASTTATVKGVNQLSKSAGSAGKNISQAKTQMEEFGRISALAIRRFAGFSIATGTIFGFIRAITGAVGAAIKFERELIKVVQVTQGSFASLRGLTSEITRLSTTLGTASQDLVVVSRTLAQAGFSARETKVALEALAKSSLAPTFRDISQTTEGAIAALKQFQLQTSSLDAVLGSVNAVAGQFAVEAEDIIGAVRRSGGVFAAAAGDLSKFSEAAKVEKFQEFISLFTSVRATTRESAETIATGLRTIFTRIQRGSTISQLRELGINLQDTEGQFIGVFGAVQQLSEGLRKLPATDQRFNRIIEELGGFRQVGKVIPLITQFGTAQNALSVAQEGVASTSVDAQIAQQTLAVQIAKTREEFAALLRDFTNTSSFRAIISLVLKTTKSLISLAGAIKPILPIITAFAAIKGAQILTGFTKGFFGGLKGNVGGGAGSTIGAGVAGAAQSTSATSSNTTALSSNTTALNAVRTALISFSRARFPGLKFANGGQVPGVGNTDSVRADLMPGEFVIRKKVVEQVGAGNLQRLNSGGRVGFVRGGAGERVVLTANEAKSLGDGTLSNLALGFGKGAATARREITRRGGVQEEAQRGEKFGKSSLSFGLVGLRPVGEKLRSPVDHVTKKGNKVRLFRSTLDEAFANSAEKVIANRSLDATKDVAKGLTGKIPGGAKIGDIQSNLKSAGFAQMVSIIFEAAIGAIGAPFGKSGFGKSIDFPLGLGSAASVFRGVPQGIPTDATRTVGARGKGNNKILAQIDRFIAANKGNIPQGFGPGNKFAKGGAATDTIPALLTPGEFVFNRDAASRIGLANLERLNAGKVEGFADGGRVGFQRGGTARDEIRRRRFEGSFLPQSAKGTFGPGFASGDLAVAQKKAAKAMNAATNGFKDQGLRGKQLVVAMRKFETAVVKGATATEAFAKVSSANIPTGGKNLGIGRRIGTGLKASQNRLAGGGALGLAFLAPQIAQSLAGDKPSVGGAGTAGAVSGGITGAFVGAQVAGPLGAVVGGVVGGLSSMADGIRNAKVEIAAAELTSATEAAASAFDNFIASGNIEEFSKLISAQLQGATGAAVARQENLGISTAGVVTSIKDFFRGGDVGIDTEGQRLVAAKGVTGLLGDTASALTNLGTFGAFGKSFDQQGAGNFAALQAAQQLEGRTQFAETAQSRNQIASLIKEQASQGNIGADIDGFDILKNLADGGNDAAKALIETRERLRLLNPGLVDIADAQRVAARDAGILAGKLREASTSAAEALGNFVQRLAESSALIADATVPIQRVSTQISSGAAQISNAATLGTSTGTQDVFANPLGKSSFELQKRFEQLSRAVGVDGTEFSNTIGDAIGGLRRLETELPELLRIAGAEVGVGSKDPAGEVLEALKSSSSFTDLPSQLQKVLSGRLEASLRNRNVKLGPGAIRELLADSGFVDKLTGGISKDILKAASNVVSQFNKLNSAYEKSLNVIIQTNLKIAAEQDKVASLQSKNQLILREFDGSRRPLTIGERTAGANARLQRLANRGGAASTNVGDLRTQLFSLIGERDRLQVRRQSLGEGRRGDVSDELKDLANRESAVVQRLDATNKALLQVRDSTDKLTAIQDKLKSIQERQSQVGDVFERLATASPTETIDIQRQLALGFKALSTGGRGIQRGQQASEALAGLRLVGQLSPELGKRVAESIKTILIGILPGISGIKLGADRGDNLGQVLKGQDKESAELRRTLQETTANQVNAANALVAAMQLQANNAGAMDKLVIGLNGFATSFKDAVDAFVQKKFAKGGAVGGIGSRDTVSARLTPGEFVVRRSVAQKNMGMLKALNAGRPQHFTHGGVVSDREKKRRSNVRSRIQELLSSIGINDVKGTAPGDIRPALIAARKAGKFPDGQITRVGRRIQRIIDINRPREGSRVVLDNNNRLVNATDRQRRAGAFIDSRTARRKAFLAGKAARRKAFLDRKKFLQDRFNNRRGKLQFAGGGGVPGQGGGDTVPAMLTPGEFVINKKSAQQNMALLKALNNGQKFAHGGPVQGAATGGISVAAPEMKVPVQFMSALNTFSSAATTLAPSLDSFNTAVSSLNAAADKLANISLPNSIDINFGSSPIQVVVSVNGAESFAGISQPIQDLIISKVGVEIRKHIDFTGATRETIG